jgi:hypothetical protein
MSTKTKFEEGYAMTFSTRPAGLSTYLLIQPYFDDKGVGDDTTCTWHIELCKQQDQDVAVKTSDASTQKIDISAAAGAFVSVRNTGGWPFTAWTDY